jgi:TonB family protein
MKTKRTSLMNVIFRWLAILPLGAIVLAAVPSCKGKTSPSESTSPPPPPPLPYNITNGDTVWFRVDEFPVYPGSSTAMYKFINQTITYPEASKKKKIQGRVVVGFILTKECKVTDARIITGIAPDCDQEALRVVNSLPQFEKPALVKGRPVAYHFTLPVHYTLK